MSEAKAPPSSQPANAETNLELSIVSVVSKPSPTVSFKIINKGTRDEKRVVVGLQSILENDDPKDKSVTWSNLIDMISAVPKEIELKRGESKTIKWTPTKDELKELKPGKPYRLYSTTLENANSAGADYYSQEFKI